MRTPFLLLIAALAAFGTMGCGSSDAAEPDIVAEYIVSNEVRNDPLATESCCEDRMAQFAAMGSPDAIIGQLLGGAPCEGRCELNDAESDAVREVPGAGAEIYVRGMLVSHEDGVLEYTTLLIARGDGNVAIIDTEGGTYDDLDDFRANNDMYEAEDWLLVAEDFANVNGENRIITVSGRTTPTYVWWLVGAGAAVVVAIVAVAVVRAIRRARSEQSSIGLDESS